MGQFKLKLCTSNKSIEIMVSPQETSFNSSFLQFLKQEGALLDCDNLPNVNKKVTLMRKIRTFWWKIGILYLYKKRPDQIKQAAIHEAGHVIAGYFTEHKVYYTSIVPDDRYGPQNSGITLTGVEWFSTPFLQVVIAYAGKVAEELFLGKSIGHYSDQQGHYSDQLRIDDLAMKMVTKWGMTEKIGYMNFATASEEDKELIMVEVNSVKAKAEEFAKQIIMEHTDGFLKIVAALMAHYHLTGKEIKEILDGNSSFFS